MRNLEYLYLEDDEAQRVVILWRPNFSRTDDSATPGVRGGQFGTGARPSRIRLRAGHSGSEVGIPDRAAGSGRFSPRGSGAGT